MIGQYNILIGCDQTYFDKFGLPLLKSINYHNPWISLHCHIVNPTKDNSTDNVDITTEYLDFSSTPIPVVTFLQAVRFLAVADKFRNNEKVITLDADSVCVRPIDPEEFDELFEKQYVYKHKNDRWLANFVVFTNNGFREELSSKLKSLPLKDWQPKRDQQMLLELSSKYNFQPLDKKWLSVGKMQGNSAFFTLKGKQKHSTGKRKNIFNTFLKESNAFK